MPPACKKSKRATRGTTANPGEPAPMHQSPPPTPPQEGNGQDDDDAALQVARQRTIAAQTETAAAEAARQATIAAIELAATRASAAKADAKAQREKANHEAIEAEKRRAHELKIAMLQAGAANAPDEEEEEFKQRRPENNAQMRMLVQRQQQTEARQREADRKQRLSTIDVPSNEARQQLMAAAEAMKRPSGTSVTGPDKKTAEKSAGSP